ncbi:MAG: hypothetical protein HY291_00255 [Planctomycetes bacterium]|nr:hypothetical protein [Planctomycetota bacterium]
MKWIAAFGWAGLLAVVAVYALFVLRYKNASLADVVCIGDSLTACGGMEGRYTDFLSKDLPGLRIINRGINGDTLFGGRERFERDVLSLHPKIVVIELGANDFFRHDRSPHELYVDLATMVRSAREQNIGVAIAGVFGDQLDEKGQPIPKLFHEGDPAFGQTILEIERTVAKQYGAIHIENIQADLTQPEYWGDNRHPNAAGNRLVAARILPAVKQLLEAQAASGRN